MPLNLSLRSLSVNEIAVCLQIVLRLFCDHTRRTSEMMFEKRLRVRAIRSSFATHNLPYVVKHKHDLSFSDQNMSACYAANVSLLSS